MTASDSQQSTSLERPLLVGALACFVGSIVLLLALFGSCSPFGGGFCSGSDLEPLVWMAGTMIVLVAIFSIAFAGGARFAMGFVAMWLALSAISGGLLFKLWAAPLYLLAHAAHPLTAPIVEHVEAATRKDQWIATTRAQTLEPIHGVRLARAVQDCVEGYEIDDPAESYPPDMNFVIQTCASLSRDRASGATSDTTRYQLGVDRGFRWTYTPGAVDASGRVTRYTIRVEPDALLEKQGPIYITDQNGLLIEHVRKDAVGTAVGSPAMFMRDVRACLAQLPAERRRRREQMKDYYREPSAFDAAARACPDVSERFRRVSSSDDVSLAVPIHERRGQFLDTASVFALTYSVVDGATDAFELHAVPIEEGAVRIHSGVRRYLMDADGRIHVTREPRQATTEDPPVPQCELDQVTACEP
jgi:hypothetical protein